MTVKQRQEFRIRLQKRARRVAERKLENYVEEQNAKTVSYLVATFPSHSTLTNVVVCEFKTTLKYPGRTLRDSTKEYQNSQITPNPNHLKMYPIFSHRNVKIMRKDGLFIEKLQSRNNILMKFAGSSWDANANTFRSSALVLCYSAAEYCCPVWQCSTHVSLVDAQLHSSMSHSDVYWWQTVETMWMLWLLFKLSQWQMTSCYTASETCSVTVLLLRFFWLLNLWSFLNV